MRHTLRSLVLGLFLPVLCSRAAAQELPKATPEGRKALETLIRACIADGGLKFTLEAPKETQLVLVDAVKMRATLRANPDLLTDAVRDSLVRGWFTTPEKSKVFTSLLRDMGELRKDANALGFAAFFTGVEARQRNEVVTANQRFEEAVRHFETARIPSWQALGLSNLGMVQLMQGKYPEGIDFYQRALALQRKTFSGPHRDTATTLGNLGAAYDQLGKYAESRGYHLQALAIEQKLAEGPNEDVAYRLGKIGSSHYKLGEYVETRDWYLKEQAMLRQLHEKPHADVASSLWHLGITYDRLRDYEKALDAHQQALFMRRQLYRSPHASIAESLHSVGQGYLQLKKFADAVKHYEQALEERRQLYPAPHRLLAESLDSLGMAYDYASDSVRALRYLEECLAMRKRLYEGPHPDVATSLGRLGSLCSGLGQPNKALEYHRQALAIRRQLDPPPWEDIAISLNNIGSAHAALAQYREALAAHHDALTLKQKLFKRPHPSLASSLNNIGHVHELLGEFEQAVKYQRQALDVLKQSTQGPNAQIASVLSNIGGVLIRLGEYQEALRYQRLSLEMRRQVYVKPHPDVAMSLSAIGTIYYAQGEYGKALDYYREAMVLRLQFFDKPHPLVRDSLSNIAAVYYHLDDYPRALIAWHAVLDLERSFYSGPHPDIASSLNNLGTVYTFQGEFGKALRYHREALDIREALHKAPHPDVALSLFNLASVYGYQKEYAKSLEYHERALVMQQKVYGEQHPAVASHLNNIGALHHKQGDHEKAVAVLDKALVTLQLPSETGPRSFEQLETRHLRPLSLTVNVLQYRGEALEALAAKTPTVERWLACGRTYDLAADMLEHLRCELLEREESKLVQGDLFATLVTRRLEVRRRLFELRGEVEDLHKAFAAAEQGRARVFLESLGETNAARLTVGLPPDLRTEEARLKQTIRSLDARLRVAQSQNDKAAATLARELWQQRLKAEDDLTEFERQLAKSHPQYTALRYPKPCSVADARKALGNREVAILFAVGKKTSFALIVQGRMRDNDPADGLAIVRLPGGKVLAEKVAAITQRERLERLEGVRALGAELHQLLLQPLEKHIGDKDLVIVPDGPLGHLPFELLIEGGAENGRYLIEKRRIRYAPSLTALHMLRLWEEGRQKRPDRPLFALGDPVFDSKDIRLIGDVRSADESLEQVREMWLREGRDALTFGRLSASGAEVRALGKLFGTPETVLTDEKATEAAVKKSSARGDLARYRYVHFATHGILGVDRNEPPALVLSLVGTSGKEDEYGRDDGFLRLPEVSGLKLNADVVVLSACRTGQGRMHNGEGVSGLARVFLYAGSRGVVCSLWSVDDSATSELMQNMYGRLKDGEPTTDALREAKLAMIRDDRPPLFWAPFIHIGR